MKKQQIKSLRLNKKSISNLGISSIKGGTDMTKPPLGLCVFTEKCFPTDNCFTIDCEPLPTMQCPPTGVCVKTEDPLGICIG